jgi:hypothetical protein
VRFASQKPIFLTSLSKAIFVPGSRHTASPIAANPCEERENDDASNRAKRNPTGVASGSVGESPDMGAFGLSANASRHCSITSLKTKLVLELDF